MSKPVPFAVPYDEKLHSKLPVVRTSERSSFTRCRQQWWWSYVDHISPMEEPRALRFGDLIHRALEAWYIPGLKRGPEPADTFVKLYDEAQENMTIRDSSSEEWADARELGVQILNNYRSHYGNDDDWEVISPEMSFQVVLLSKSGEPFVRVLGRLDLLVRSVTTKRIFPVDHKTAASIGTTHLALDDQAGTYWTFAPVHLRSLGLMGERDEFDYIVYNFIRKAAPDLRPEDAQGRKLNKDGSVSLKQPAAYFLRHPVMRTKEDCNQVVDRVRKQTWEMHKVLAGQLPVYKSINFTCGFCKYLSLCELHETGADWEEYIKMAFVTRDPYAQYDEEMKET